MLKPNVNLYYFRFCYNRRNVPAITRSPLEKSCVQIIENTTDIEQKKGSNKKNTILFDEKQSKNKELTNCKDNQMDPLPNLEGNDFEEEECRDSIIFSRAGSSPISSPSSKYPFDLNLINPNEKPEPYYVPLDNSDKTLIFESRFESGNLARAVKINNEEYHLIMQNDTLTNGNRQCNIKINT